MKTAKTKDNRTNRTDADCIRETIDELLAVYAALSPENRKHLLERARALYMKQAAE